MGIGFLLGALNFIKSNWKLALIVAAALFLWHWHNSAVDDAFDNGVKLERSHWEEKAALEDKKNRQFEVKLQSSIEKFNKTLEEKIAERVVIEGKATETINTIIRENPIYVECKADESVLKLRNEIRELGPK